MDCETLAGSDGYIQKAMCIAGSCNLPRSLPSIFGTLLNMRWGTCLVGTAAAAGTAQLPLLAHPQDRQVPEEVQLWNGESSIHSGEPCNA